MKPYLAIAQVHLPTLGTIEEGEFVYLDLTKGICTHGDQTKPLPTQILKNCIKAGWFRPAMLGELDPNAPFEASAQRVVDTLYKNPALAKAVYELMYKTIGTLT